MSAPRSAEELAAAGGRPRFITYVGMDHRVPPQLFTDGAWRQWLFEQRKRAVVDPPGHGTIRHSLRPR